MARVSDVFPAVVLVPLCSQCGKDPALCRCESEQFCGICWLLAEHCYCDSITYFLDEEDVEFIEPLGPPPIPQPLLPNLWRLDEDVL